MKQAQKIMCVHAFVNIHKSDMEKYRKESDNSCIITKSWEMGKDY